MAGVWMCLFLQETMVTPFPFLGRGSLDVVPDLLRMCPPVTEQSHPGRILIIAVVTFVHLRLLFLDFLQHYSSSSLPWTLLLLLNFNHH